MEEGFHMKTRILIALTCLSLVAACGEGTVEETTTTTTAESTTTSAPAETTSTTTVDTTSTTASDSEATGDLSRLQAAMAGSAEATPTRVEGVIEIDLPEGAGQDTAQMPMTIMIDPESGNSAMTMDMAAMAAATGETEGMPPEFAELMGEMEVRQIGDTVYMKFPFFTAFLGAETEWISLPAEEGEGMTDDMSPASPSDPGDFLESFSDVEGSVEELGTEDIRGTETTHYRLTVDESWQDELSEEELAELEAQGPLPDTSFPIDLWVDGEGLVHRMMMEMDAEEFSGEDQDFEGMTMTFDFFDYGESVTIEAPPADQVTDMSDFEGAFGGTTP